jgi:hypothetical protein
MFVVAKWLILVQKLLSIIDTEQSILIEIRL